MIIDKDFKPIYLVCEEMERGGNIPFSISVFRDDELLSTFKSKITKNFDESYTYFKQMFLTVFWIYGGNKVFIKGNEKYLLKILDSLLKDEEVKITLETMKEIFHSDVLVTYSKEPLPKRTIKKVKLASSFKGNRIGFDAGGSDRKVSSVVDGKVIFEEETVWLPKENPDWHYHEKGIIDSLNKAAEKLKTVDAVGVSTSGIIIDNKMVQAALFVKVPRKDIIEHVETIYIDIIKKKFPSASFSIINDGDISAIAGANYYKKKNVLGLAFGTSEAAGYCYNNKTISGYFNELSKVPIDFNPNAAIHKTMGIKGAGSRYLSQSGAIRLAEMQGMSLNGTLAEKLKQIQQEVVNNNPLAINIFKDMGIYLATALIFYSRFYKIDNVIILGRVTSSVGGEIMLNSCMDYLKEHKRLENVTIYLPDENFRRLGQSFIASSIG